MTNKEYGSVDTKFYVDGSRELEDSNHATFSYSNNMHAIAISP